jgi:hypothetical protein
MSLGSKSLAVYGVFGAPCPWRSKRLSPFGFITADSTQLPLRKEINLIKKVMKTKTSEYTHSVLSALSIFPRNKYWLEKEVVDGYRAGLAARMRKS